LGKFTGMRLTKKEAIHLKVWQKYRYATPTFLALLPRFPQILRMLPLVLVLGLCAFASESLRYRWWLFGLLTGVGLAKVASISTAIGGWRLLREVIDWKRSDELLRDYESLAQSVAQLRASPRGGPTMPHGNSGVSGGPPTVN
jgi:hypothetical protein